MPPYRFNPGIAWDPHFGLIFRAVWKLGYAQIHQIHH
jgi:hypothetical protein